MTDRRLVVVSAGLSRPSSTRLLADQLSTAAVRELAERGAQAEVEVVELREHAKEIANNLVTGFPGAELRAVLDSVAAADGLIAVTPVFQASYSGLFKSFFDVLDGEALIGTPALLGATGGSPRHSLVLEHAMRPMFGYLRSVVVPTAVYAAAEDWGGGGAGRALSERVDRAAAEFAPLVAARESAPVADGFDDPVPFEQLMASYG
ncbi:FMN reductase [Saccharopolyspora sp. HNM0983]|uniref:FMN reductase n=1 Tax=Saccharopolyspora montiporae TaxID=2781240 RepID=A0A929BD07_9PSEU|nr:FMN reductase [Saccharopolyspora sp. HNM0983]MBE9376576.1 FMN reductase [Saccharopolyspora sp. HNM0983]